MLDKIASLFSGSDSQQSTDADIQMQKMKMEYDTQIARYERNVHNIGRQFYALPDSISSMYKYYDSIVFEPKKSNELKSIVLVAVSHSQLVLFDGDNDRIMSSDNPRVEFERKSKSEWFIEQIHTSHNSDNQGNTLMSYFLKYAKENDISTITGELLPDSEKEGENHWERLQSYYEKYGFTVTWHNNQHSKGDIKLIITS